LRPLEGNHGLNSAISASDSRKNRRKSSRSPSRLLSGAAIQRFPKYKTAKAAEAAIEDHPRACATLSGAIARFIAALH
jgi:hypothetical protein